MQRLLLLVVPTILVGCAGSSVTRANAYRDAAAAIFPPPSGYGLGPVYTVNYMRADGESSRRSYDRFNASYQELLSDVDACVVELDSRLNQPGGRLPFPTIPIASVQLLECVENHGWMIGIEHMWITN